VLVPSVSVNTQRCFNSGFHLPSPQANNPSGSKFFRHVRKIAKVTISFVMSVRPSVLVSLEQLDSHCTDVDEISYLRIFQKSVTKIRVSIKSDKNTRRPTYVHVR
jgi:hypothetical protein